MGRGAEICHKLLRCGKGVALPYALCDIGPAQQGQARQRERAHIGCVHIHVNVNTHAAKASKEGSRSVYLALLWKYSYSTNKNIRTHSRVTNIIISDIIVVETKLNSFCPFFVLFRVHAGFANLPVRHCTAVEVVRRDGRVHRGAVQQAGGLIVQPGATPVVSS